MSIARTLAHNLVAHPLAGLAWAASEAVVKLSPTCRRVRLAEWLDEIGETIHGWWQA